MGAHLRDFGEFRLINEIILPILSEVSEPSALGSDVAYLGLAPSAVTLVVTTDAAPRPLAWTLGHESYTTWGWYAVLINASDLAASGASPLGFTSSIEAPDVMEVDSLADFFNGIAEACARMGLKSAGGNIRSAAKFACHGAALGLVSDSSRIGRSGCEPGNLLFAIGPCGEFATAYLAGLSLGFDGLSCRQQQVLTRPQPQLREMRLLRQVGVIRAASDNSDGVLGAIWNLLERSKCSAILDFDGINLADELRSVARQNGLDPWNLFLFWGDWQVVVAVDANKLQDFLATAEANEIQHTHLGRIEAGPPKLLAEYEGEVRPLRLLRNENFSDKSFNSDVADHVQWLLRTSIWKA